MLKAKEIFTSRKAFFSFLGAFLVLLLIVFSLTIVFYYGHL